METRSRARTSGLLAGMLLAAIGFSLPACNVGVGGGGGTNPPVGGNDDDDDDNGGAVTEEEVRIRFINESDLDVDTQFYATNEDLENPGEDLFQPQYRIQASIGVAGTGIVQADKEDEITFPCTGSTALGTDGGEFLDPDTGELVATGTRRFVVVGPNFDCGNTVLFGFTEDVGEYDSVPPIPDSRG